MLKKKECVVLDIVCNILSFQSKDMTSGGEGADRR